MAETENRKLDPDEMFAALSKKISDSGMDMDMGRIEAAYNMAKLAHSGQLRKDGSPYVTHCVAAADIAADMGLDEDSIVAALLHDVIEDTDLTHSDIAKQFGEPVANIVEGVTKLTRVQYTSKEDEQMENLRKMLMAMAPTVCTICEPWHIRQRKSSVRSRLKRWRYTPPSRTASVCREPSGSLRIWHLCTSTRPAIRR